MLRRRAKVVPAGLWLATIVAATFPGPARLPSINRAGRDRQWPLARGEGQHRASGGAAARPDCRRAAPKGRRRDVHGQARPLRRGAQRPQDGRAFGMAKVERQ